MYAAEAAKTDPEKPAIVMATGGEVVTFGEYEAAANRVAHLLRDAGLRRRDHMAIFMDNDPRMLMAEGGAERTGLYYTCVNSYLSADEVVSHEGGREVGAADQEVSSGPGLELHDLFGHDVSHDRGVPVGPLERP